MELLMPIFKIKLIKNNIYNLYNIINHIHIMINQFLINNIMHKDNININKHNNHNHNHNHKMIFILKQVLVLLEILNQKD